jgi:hypothetical protein
MFDLNYYKKMTIFEDEYLNCNCSSNNLYINGIKITNENYNQYKDKLSESISLNIIKKKNEIKTTPKYF